MEWDEIKMEWDGMEGGERRGGEGRGGQGRGEEETAIDSHLVEILRPPSGPGKHFREDRLGYSLQTSLANNRTSTWGKSASTISLPRVIKFKFLLQPRQ